VDLFARFVCLHETDFVDHLLIGMRADRMYEVMAWMNFFLRYVKFDDSFSRGNYLYSAQTSSQEQGSKIANSASTAFGFDRVCA
jgi:hypothetical protein